MGAISCSQMAVFPPFAPSGYGPDFTFPAWISNLKKNLIGCLIEKIFFMFNVYEKKIAKKNQINNLPKSKNEKFGN